MDPRFLADGSGKWTGVGYAGAVGMLSKELNNGLGCFTIRTVGASLTAEKEFDFFYRVRFSVDGGT